MKKILITDPIHKDAVYFLEQEGFIVHERHHISSSALKECISEYEALICRTSTKITEDILEAAKNLRCIGVHATGWDHIDLVSAKKRNILLLGYPPDSDSFFEDRLNGSFVPVAEYVLMNMLVVSKRLLEANQSMKSGKWEKYSLSGTELHGKTLGIIGLGRIGSLVAERAKAFGMRVIAHHPRLQESGATKRGASLVSLETLLQESDFITIHVPKTTETTGMIDNAAFQKMSKKPVLINTSRASVINEKDLESALSNNLLKAAVLDVFEHTPSGINWNLVKHPRVIATPHIAGVSDEGLKRVSTHISNIVTDYLKYGKINGLIE